MKIEKLFLLVVVFSACRLTTVGQSLDTNELRNFTTFITSIQNKYNSNANISFDLNSQLHYFDDFNNVEHNSISVHQSDGNAYIETNEMISFHSSKLDIMVDKSDSIIYLSKSKASKMVEEMNEFFMWAIKNSGKINKAQTQDSVTYSVIFEEGELIQLNINFQSSLKGSIEFEIFYSTDNYDLRQFSKDEIVWKQIITISDLKKDKFPIDNKIEYFISESNKVPIPSTNFKDYRIIDGRIN